MTNEFFRKKTDKQTAKNGDKTTSFTFACSRRTCAS